MSVRANPPAKLSEITSWVLRESSWARSSKSAFEIEVEKSLEKVNSEDLVTPVGKALKRFILFVTSSIFEITPVSVTDDICETKLASSMIDVREEAKVVPSKRPDDNASE